MLCTTQAPDITSHTLFCSMVSGRRQQPECNNENLEAVQEDNYDPGDLMPPEDDDDMGVFLDEEMANEDEEDAGENAVRLAITFIPTFNRTFNRCFYAGVMPRFAPTHSFYSNSRSIIDHGTVSYSMTTALDTIISYYPYG